MTMTMRVLTGAAAAAALMFCSAAAAQTDPPPAPSTPPPPSRCGEMSAAPAAPDPAAATSEQMQAAVAAYETWSEAATTVLECRRAEALELRAAADARASEFNAANTAAREASTVFVAAVEAYNERHPDRSRRR